MAKSHALLSTSSVHRRERGTGNRELGMDAEQYYLHLFTLFDV